MFAASAGEPSPGVYVPAILLVEDEVLIRMAMADALRSAGFIVVEAAHADEALSILDAAVEIDLVMTDVRMPGSMDGLELVTHLRATRPGLKLVIVSGEWSSTKARDTADLFFPKPCNMNVVIEKISQLLEDLK